MSPQRRRRILQIFAVLLFLLTAAWQVPVLMRGPPRAALSVHQLGPPIERAEVRVVSLNLAHGRARRFHQLVLATKTIKRHLNHAGAVLSREQATYVALQEADGPSAWSGRFNHVEFLAEAAGIPFWTRGEHAVGLGLSYGTALLSATPMHESTSITFDPTPPTLPKGFVFATVPHPKRPQQFLDIVSVHLDFASRSRRQRQVEQMLEVLEGRHNPLIIMGDFNCQWTDKDSPLPALAKRLKLHTHAPKKHEATFPFTNKRLDWILVSEGITFVDYEVLEDPLSDHLAIAATLRLGP